MIKKFILSLLFIVPFIANAQSGDPWQIGLNASPFYFGRYNDKVNKEIDKQDLPNGYLFGLSAEKNFSSNWGIKTGLEYSFQNRKDIQYFPVMSGSTVSADFEYLKLPVMLQYSRKISSMRNLFLILNQGAQVSRLTNYYSILDDYLQTVIYSSGERRLYGKETGVVDIRPNQPFRKYVYGVVGSIGLKKNFSSNFSYSLHMRYEFDITDADKELFHSSMSHTHNYRLGLLLGIHYHLNKN